VSTPADKLREAAQRAQDVNQHVTDAAAKIVQEREAQSVPTPVQEEAHADGS
jgi:hypothetical protein